MVGKEIKVINISKVIKEIREEVHHGVDNNYGHGRRNGLIIAERIIKDNIKEVGFDESGEISFHTYDKIKLNDNSKTDTKK